MRLDATEGEGRSAFFVLRDDQSPAKVAILCKTGVARKRVSICIPTEQDLIKKRLFGGKPAVILDCLHVVNSFVAWSHEFVLRPFAEGGLVELLPGFGNVTGLERGLLSYRNDLLNPKERPKTRAEFLARLEDFYTVRFSHEVLPAKSADHSASCQISCISGSYPVDSLHSPYCVKCKFLSNGEQEGRYSHYPSEINLHCRVYLFPNLCLTYYITANRTLRGQLGK